MSRFSGLFGRLRPPHGRSLQLTRGIVVRRRVLLRGEAVRAACTREEMPGFFALAAEVARSPRDMDPRLAGAAVTHSLRRQAEGADEEAAPRTRDVTLRSDPTIP